ncbi:putative ferric uptake regulator FurB [Microlunatus endophyticus]|uniref:Ferric uptake regulator FurB n=1 Tax=Microlunatus endophyticus TaxID=1716077 RepID=A0A917W2P4_9ACTN|nr:Fur family transcriptional regulator [Microlunatus endophyticus]GGL56121.1 putative ferric uptake regulator FurB [Microlunatus endophyticus]
MPIDDGTGLPGRARKHRATTQGRTIRSILERQDRFLSAQDLYARLRTEGHRIGLSTVYRHLQSWAEDGTLDTIHRSDGEATYRFCGDPGTRGHHHHLVCRRCGQAAEVEGRAVERWADQTAQQLGYTDVDHTVEIFGICATCTAETA